MKRESTGIKDIDAMIQGGLPKGSIIGLEGPPGVGKSIMTMHFLLEGARKGQKCLYINLEEPKSNIDSMVRQFSFAEEFFKLVEEEKIVVMCMSHSKYEKLESEITEKIRENKDIRRLVIDSFNCYFNYLIGSGGPKASAESSIRHMISLSLTKLRKEEMTTILVLEAMSDGRREFSYNIPFLVDGIISLKFIEIESLERRIFIPKMRWTDQCKESKAYEVGKGGIHLIGEQ